MDSFSHKSMVALPERNSKQKKDSRLMKASATPIVSGRSGQEELV